MHSFVQLHSPQTKPSPKLSFFWVWYPFCLSVHFVDFDRFVITHLLQWVTLNDAHFWYWQFYFPFLKFANTAFARLVDYTTFRNGSRDFCPRKSCFFFKSKPNPSASSPSQRPIGMTTAQSLTLFARKPNSTFFAWSLKSGYAAANFTSPSGTFTPREVEQRSPALDLGHHLLLLLLPRRFQSHPVASGPRPHVPSGSASWLPRPPIGARPRHSPDVV